MWYDNFAENVNFTPVDGIVWKRRNARAVCKPRLYFACAFIYFHVCCFLVCARGFSFPSDKSRRFIWGLFLFLVAHLCSNTTSVVFHVCKFHLGLQMCFISFNRYYSANLIRPWIHFSFVFSSFFFFFWFCFWDKIFSAWNASDDMVDQ